MDFKLVFLVRLGILCLPGQILILAGFQIKTDSFQILFFQFLILKKWKKVIFIDSKTNYIQHESLDEEDIKKQTN